MYNYHRTGIAVQFVAFYEAVAGDAVRPGKGGACPLVGVGGFDGVRVRGSTLGDRSTPDRENSSMSDTIAFYGNRRNQTEISPFGRLGISSSRVV